MELINALSDFKIKKLEDFSVDEKARLFDKIYNQALTIYQACVLKERYSDKEYHCYESVMEVLSPDNVQGFWDHFNKLIASLEFDF